MHKSYDLGYVFSRKDILKMVSELGEREVLPLGRTQSFDDTIIIIHYGIGQRNGMPCLVSWEETLSGWNNARKTDHFPNIYERHEHDFRGWPSPEKLEEEISQTLKNGNKLSLPAKIEITS